LVQLKSSAEIEQTCTRLIEKCVKVRPLPASSSPSSLKFQLEQDNQALASLADFLSRLVDAAVSPPRHPLPESPTAARASLDIGSTQRSSEEGSSGQAPALSLELLQWEQMRVDQSLIVHIATSAAKIAQWEASAMEAAALHQDTLTKLSEQKEECARLRLHGSLNNICYHFTTFELIVLQCLISNATWCCCGRIYQLRKLLISKQSLQCRRSTQQP
jgi:hypothetical protein